MVVEQSNIDHIMRGLQSTEGVRLHNHRKKLRQRFDIIKKLGQGTYGKVQLGINKETGQEVAIKAIKKCKIETEADLVRIRREIQIMSSVRHPNIIHIYEVFENREKMVLVMEYAAGGELYDFLSERKVLEETEARRIFRQISTAVYYCHKHKICHRDLKLENILLDENGNAKIADFGLSNVYDEQRLLNSFCGSPLYASPEIVKGTPYHGPEVDCWSLGVLLYTLVYGAMPFDGSNFKRLVKQISQGVYFEPKNPSSASPLIREMLTVNPQKRATIEQICSHWWVNQGFNVSCLDIAEDLANQTPVRLDLLLSLAPPPENAEKLVVTDDQNATSKDAPARSLSVGSFMELDPNTEQRIREFVAHEVPSDSNEKTVKRKLEPDASESSIKKEGARKKERIKLNGEQLKESEEIDNKDDTGSGVMDVDLKTNKASDKEEEETTTDVSAKMEEMKPQDEVPKVPKEIKTEEEAKPEGAIAKDKPTRKSVKIVKKKVVKEGEKEKEESEGADSKIKVKKKKKEEGEAEAKKEEIKPEEKQDAKEKEETGKEIKRDSATRKSQGSGKAPTKPSEEAPAPKLAERRKSKIFETAEKFMTNDPKSPSPEKPKKVFIPGVKVSDFAKAFERKSSLTSTPSVKSSPSRKSISKEADRKSEERTKESPEKKAEAENSSQKTEEDKPKKEEEEPKPTEITDEKLKKLKDSARNIISNALVEEERKKIKKQILKPPVPKTKPEESEGKKPLTLQIGKETATVQVHSPENTKFLFDAPTETSGENKENIEGSNEKKTSKMEITLRSNTLPRGGKTESRLKSPPSLEKTENFRTEVEQRVGDPHSRFTTQRSEVAFPVSAPQRPARSMSLEPEVRKTQTKERIIPIQLEGGEHKEESEARDRIKDLERPKMQYQRTLSQRSASLSRQSTQDSDTDATPTAPGEAIKKSPREFIIPIAVEGGGYVTPRATSLEPSDTLASKRGIRPFTRKISLFSDNGSEDESPFSTLPRHTDLDEPFRLHRLRSTRPLRSSFDKADSGSGSEEEEEDDDGFEILTAENLFSTLLSRVRSLTQRLNVDSGIRPGFPSSRLTNHFSPSERLFSNIHHPMQTSQASIKYRTSVVTLSERPGFGRSLSRDIENGFGRRGRSDLTNSDSARALSREKSKRSESDTESISESSYSSTRRKTKTSDEKKLKRIPRVKSSLSTQSEENRNRQGESTKSLIPRRSYQRQVSDSELMEPMHPTLHRTLSVKSNKGSERKSIGITDQLSESGEKVKDFYDILAEKYGIRNVKRYDLPVEKPKKKTEEVPPEMAPDEKKPEELPPIPPKTKKEEPEKCKAPSEKLAAVLNRLENGNKTKKKPQQKEEFKPVDKERLAALSPQALELYEKTLALYQKKKEDETKTKLMEKRETPEKSVLSKYLPGMEGEKVGEDYFNEKKLKHYGSLKSRLTEEKNRKAENKEVPVRRKSLKEGEAEKKEERIKRLSKDLEAELNKEAEEEQKKKNKILSSLEKKFEKFRNERKYVDKAIRSLRESSVGPKDVSSENVLIKRAVSVSDCSPKGVQSNRVQSTVNSVLGIFKKIESSKENGEESKIPIARVKPSLEIELPKKNKTESPRRASYAAGSYTSRNDLSLHKSPSSLLGWDDSSSMRSPDSESFDSWSNCSDLGSPDDLNYRGTMRHSKTNFDEMSTESVGDRIRRKSFYTRFNERKKPRRSSLLESRRKYDNDDSKSEFPSKSYDEQRPRPFYKNEPEKTVYRKTSFDWPKPISTPAFSRINSQSSTFSGYATLSRSYMDSFKESRFSRMSGSLYKTGSRELERALSPVRPFSPNRALSPNHCRSPSQNSLD